MGCVRRQAGDTLVEVVMAIAIISVTFATAFNVANNSYRIGIQARERTQVGHIIQDQAERLRARRDELAVANITNDNPIMTAANFNAVPTSCFGIPTCTVTVANVATTEANARLRKVTSTITVRWQSLIGNEENTSTINYSLSDTRGVAPCNNDVAGGCL